MRAGGSGASWRVARGRVGGRAYRRPVSTRTHVCVYFDDGELDHGCVCGSRAILVLDEDGLEALVVLDDDGATVTTLTTGRPERHELLVSA